MIILFHLCVQAFTIKFFFFAIAMIGKKGRAPKKRKKETVFRGTGKQKLARSLSPYSTGEFAFKMFNNILSHT